MCWSLAPELGQSRFRVSIDQMVESDENTILVTGAFNIRDLAKLVAALYDTVDKKGCQDVVLDFSQCQSAYAGPMLGVVARAQTYWSDGIDVALVLPRQPTLRRRFLNTSWAHLIDFRGHAPSTYRGNQQVPATKFRGLCLMVDFCHLPYYINGVRR